MTLFALPRLFLLSLLFSSVSVFAAVRLPAIISDHMVLSRTAATAVWGMADPGERVSVSVAGVESVSVADADGRWKLALDLSGVGEGPFEMRVRGTNELVVSDVLVGEVWLAGGQSNMEFPLSRSAGAQEEIASNIDAGLRHFRVRREASDVPLEDCHGRWVSASLETSGDFAAVGYYFGKRLRAELGVPVGIVSPSWGGTQVEAWTSREALLTDEEIGPGAQRQLEAITSFPTDIATWRNDMTQWLKTHGRLEDADAADPVAELAGLHVAAADWHKVEVPSWKVGEEFLPDGGVVWLRKRVSLNAKLAGSRLVLRLGRVDGYETVFWNGKVVDRTTIENHRGVDYRRTFQVPAELAMEGENELMMRVHVPAGRLAIPYEPRVSILALGGDWDMYVEKKYEPLARNDAMPTPPHALSASEHTPGNLFNGMINPILNQTVRGAIWYQGEANAGRAFQYRRALPLLIADWRSRLGHPDLPFYICQVANFYAKETAPSESAWAELREAQALTAANVPGAGLAVLIDSGESADIHPRNKAIVGERLARIALARDYGRDVVWSGPVYRSMQVDGGKIRLGFDHIHGGLSAHPVPENYDVRTSAGATAPLVRNSPDSQLEGFAICGKDANWVWAQARIEGNEVVVWSDAVPQPSAVRYNWANNPSGNLYNTDGLPAVPFRTDDFPALTRNRSY